jgi:membrane associated rhomboid family serine protease
MKIDKKDEISVSRQHIDSKMINRLRIYTVIAIVMLILVAYEVLQGTFSIQLAILGILGGLIVGSIVGRMYRLDWDEDNSNVTGI